MPSFSEEENTPVLARSSLASALSTTTPIATSTSAKSVSNICSAAVAGPPVLTSVDRNVNGRRPLNIISPPPPSSPPPSPPFHLKQDYEDELELDHDRERKREHEHAPAAFADEVQPFYFRPARLSRSSRQSSVTDDDNMSAGSSVDMACSRSGGAPSSASGGAASSHATSAPPDDNDPLEAKDDFSPVPALPPPPPPPVSHPPPPPLSSTSTSLPQRPASASSSSSSLHPTPQVLQPTSPAPAQTQPPATQQRPLREQDAAAPAAPNRSSPPPPPPKPERLSRPLPNGSSSASFVSLHSNDRSPIVVPPPHPTQPAPPPPRTNGFSIAESGRATGDADVDEMDAQPRTSAGSASSSFARPSPADLYVRQVRNSDIIPALTDSQKTDTAAVHGLGVVGGGTLLAAGPATSTLTTPESIPRSHFSSQSLNPPQQQQQHYHQQQAGPSPVAPHRFSSPPAYHAGSATPGASPATATSSSLQSPPTGGVKHRHTLEVPKPTPARNSREGLDAGAASVFGSGRFSPTSASAAAIASGSGSSIGGGRRPSLSLGRRNTRSLHSEMPRDEVVPDEDALRWTEAYRQKRASKKRRMEQDDDQVLVGTKVDESHTNWVVAYNMLTGIRVSVSRTNAKLDRPLTDEDFETKQKSTFDIAGNELVPSAKYDFKFKDYAPWVFRHLRAKFHLDPADYLMSLAGKYILSELGSPGKSGSFFYFSRDYRYIIKTIHHAEHKFLRKILREYYQHVTENPNTLLSQFFGLHRVKMPYGRKIHFVVMNNLFPPHRDIHQTFDLKGSTIGRDYPEDHLAQNARATLKDLNWLRRHQHLELGIIKKQMFLEQLRRDVKLLKRLQIMDYSLLVGVHDLRRGNDENLRDKTLQVFEPRGENNHPAAGDPQAILMRTPSKLEHQRKTRELRQRLQLERPIPIGQSSNRMPDELDDNKKSVFYQDDGGFQATHQDNAPGEEIYYLGVIDCLTHYGIVKKIEHFWKGLSHDRAQISALPPQQYGERFMNFMSGITMSPEDAARERAENEAAAAAAAATAAAASPATVPAVPADEKTTTMSESGAGRRETRDAVVAGATLASGRDNGKESADQGGLWMSGLRRRPGVSQAASSSSVQQPPQPPQQPQQPQQQQQQLDGGEKITAAHRAAENEAQDAAPLPDESEVSRVTRTTVLGSGGVVLPIFTVAPGSPQSTSSQNSSGGGALGPVSHGSLGSFGSLGSLGAPHGDRRESLQQPGLPIVDEAGEGSSTGGQTRSSQSSSHTVESSGRPVTPSKDGTKQNGGAGFGHLALMHSGNSSRSGSGGRGSDGSNASSNNGVGRKGAGTCPPSPPSTSGYLKPESADSGYGVSGSGTRSRSGTVGSGRKLTLQLSRESLDKALPPLPALDTGTG